VDMKGVWGGGGMYVAQGGLDLFKGTEKKLFKGTWGGKRGEEGRKGCRGKGGGEAQYGGFFVAETFPGKIGFFLIQEGGRRGEEDGAGASKERPC